MVLLEMSRCLYKLHGTPDVSFSPCKASISVRITWFLEYECFHVVKEFSRSVLADPFDHFGTFVEEANRKHDEKMAKIPKREYVNFEGRDPETSILNMMLNTILVSSIKFKNKSQYTSATLFIGNKQYHALKCIESGDVREVKEDHFCGWPIVRVLKEDFCKLL